MRVTNSILIARVVRQTQLMARLDKELITQQDNMKELNNLVRRVVTADIKLSVINTISLSL